MTVQLSPNFTLAELTVTNTGLDNQPSWQEHNTIVNRLQQLAVRVLQKVRDRFGPTKVNSAFRNEQVNKKVGGVPSSQHRKGEAADIEVPGVDNLEVARWMAHNLTFDQLILEDYVGGNSGWIHVSYRAGKNRKQVFTKPKGSKEFKPGLPGSASAAIAETAETNWGKIAGVVAGTAAAAWFFLKKK